MFSSEVDPKPLQNSSAVFSPNTTSYPCTVHFPPSFPFHFSRVLPLTWTFVPIVGALRKCSSWVSVSSNQNYVPWRENHRPLARFVSSIDTQLNSSLYLYQTCYLQVSELETLSYPALVCVLFGVFCFRSSCGTSSIDLRYIILFFWMRCWESSLSKENLWPTILMIHRPCLLGQSFFLSDSFWTIQKTGFLFTFVAVLLQSAKRRGCMR